MHSHQLSPSITTVVQMSIIVPSSHTSIGAWVNSKNVGEKSNTFSFLLFKAKKRIFVVTSYSKIRYRKIKINKKRLNKKDPEKVPILAREIQNTIQIPKNNKFID